jgi:hypothetical protein
MVDFKYHVVSIVAVFLALAVGIVLGTNVLSGDVLQNLKTQTSDLRKEAQDLRAQITEQQKQIAADESFARLIEPVAVSGQLNGYHVAVVTMPDASNNVRDRVVKTLAAAGAVVTTEVSVDDSYADPQRVASLQALLRTLGSATFDPVGDVGARAARTLATALVGSLPSAPGGTPSGTVAVAGSPSPGNAPPVSPPPSRDSASATPTSPSGGAPSGAPSPPSGPTPPRSVAPPDARQVSPASIEVLSGMQTAGFVKLDRQPTDYADLVVVVCAAAPTKTPTPTASPSPGAGAAKLDLVAALQRAGSQTVVVGPAGSAQPGTLLAKVRANSSLQKVISGIDNVDIASGRIAMVYALRAQTGGTVGQYGNGPGAAGPLPTNAQLGESPTASTRPTTDTATAATPSS